MREGKSEVTGREVLEKARYEGRKNGSKKRPTLDKREPTSTNM